MGHARQADHRYMIGLMCSKYTGNLYNKSQRPKLQLPDTEKHLPGRIPSKQDTGRVGFSPPSVGWTLAPPYVKVGRSPPQLSSSGPLFIKTVPVKRGATTA